MTVEEQKTDIQKYVNEKLMKVAEEVGREWK